MTRKNKTKHVFPITLKEILPNACTEYKKNVYANNE